MTKRGSSGFTNSAADKIWNDHLGNNAYVRHRAQCTLCRACQGEPCTCCAEGSRIFDVMLEEVLTEIDEVLTNQN